ncbi:glucosaminidase domain-containing protein [Agriterribacter sp.]|uniref:glucosaminidase domain-containing protein n=1 Tax=Agriterribacter sp. TaxID=2821509 RepID=UPI002D0AF878|nr:glucosaminidase domain-containing protein [Agriterribacter sp.]HRO47563.1 glucosaminidase domain-containing protein [Agriterribacter sp.]HRQ18792.1 glucosaminidase domain-containing protein [Agriterribacter sp.]
MIKKVNILLVCAIFGYSTLTAQNPAIIRYINTYKFLAIQEMQRTGVPASIKLAQGILETQAGESDLVKRSNNHFGIKCKTGWSGDKVYHDDDERGECFRAYASAEDSYRDHSDFLKRSQRYAFLFQLDPADYKDWAKGLKKAGYATNPKYTQQLIKYIEAYDLQLYTLVALGKRKMEAEQPVYAVDGQAVPVVSTAAMVQDSEDIRPEVEVKALRLRYPEEAFRINDTRVIVALAGTPLLAIAEQYGVRYKHLLEFNELTEPDDIIRKDQLIFLQRKRRQGANAFHIVRKAETLYDIAQEEGIRLDHLLAYNQLRGNETPAAGQRLFLQKDAAQHTVAEVSHNITGTETAKLEQTPPAVNAPAQFRFVKHVVQQKETLFSIARKYEVEIEQIRAWNRLNDNAIRSGQELLIYKN